MDLLTVVRTSAAISRFVEKDLRAYLGVLDMQAASNALQSAQLANDKRSAYWSVVNHLESAESKFQEGLNTPHRFQAAQSVVYTLALKAIVYRYLGEEELVKRCFEASADTVARQNELAWKGSNQFLDIFSWWNPGNWAKMIRFNSSELGKEAKSFAPEPFWKELGYTGRYFELDIGPDPDPR